MKVIFGVDATELHVHSSIKNQKFSSLVFNFPHVGGKMKIHLNRKLLEAFFKSACNVLLDYGKILVTLCAGQGGIPLDSVTRRWDDSWQVVLMAARADLILKRVDNFDPTIYFGYLPTGYRSMEKGFDQSGAITYTFKKSPCVSSFFASGALCTEDVPLCDKTYMKMPYFLAAQMRRNLCSDVSTLIGQICSLIIKHISKSFIVNVGDIIVSNEILSVCDVFKYYKSEASILHDKMVNVHPLYALKNTPSFSIEIFLGIVCCEKSVLFETVFSDVILLDIKNSNKSTKPLSKSVIWRDFLQGPFNVSPAHFSVFQTSKVESENLKCFALNLTELSRVYFEVDKHELWSYGQDVRVENDFITYSPCSLFPLEYVYDLSFWQCSLAMANQSPDKSGASLTGNQTNDEISMDLDAVATVITNVAQDKLIDYELLGTYFHPEIKQRSFTYRIRYKSFYQSLSDKTAKYIHSQIGLKLQECLGVEIR